MTNPSLTGAAPDDFRQLLSCFATGVTVATTTDHGGTPYGMTASAVSAVSLDPPLLLICVNRDASFHAALRAGNAFALNVLADDQELISQRFAQSDLTPFDGVAFTAGPRGVPLLAGVVAHILCDPWETHEAGDHTVFFGRVTGGARFERLPLLHYRSHYTTTSLRR